jgi:chemotaxis protein histidine kinase CheA
MVELEKDPGHKPSLDNVFRTIHTVKGTCGFLAFGNLEKLAHTGESSQECGARADGLGVSGYVAKPFKEESLRERIRAVIPLEAKG